MDFNDLYNPVFLQRKVIGKKCVARAFWLLSSRAETGPLMLHQLPCVAGWLVLFLKALCLPVAPCTLY